jgi:hypothetical protein
VIGAYVASTVVTLAQYARARDRRLLPLTALFLVPAFALSRGWGEGWSDVFLGAVCLVGLVLVVVLPGRVLAMARSPETVTTTTTKPDAKGVRPHRVTEVE